MNIIRGLIILFGGTLAIFLIYAAFQESAYKIEAKEKINANPKQVIEFLNNVDNWNLWHTWSDVDSTLQYSSSEMKTGVGAEQIWQGEFTRKGKMVFTNITQNKIEFQLDFVNGGNVSNGYIEVRALDSVSVVEWVVYGDAGWNPFLRLSVGNISELMNPEFQKKLLILKKKIEENL